MTTLEKIRAELHATAEMHEDGEYYLRDKWVDEIIGKYAEQEKLTIIEANVNGYTQGLKDAQRQSCENCKHDRKACGNDDHYGFCQNWEYAEQEPTDITTEYAVKTIQELMIACTPDSKYYRVGQMAISAMLENEELSKDLDEALKEIDEYEQGLEQEPCERFEWGIDGNVYKIIKAKDGKEICQQVCDDVVSRQAMINLIRGCNSALEEPRIFNCHNAGVKFEQYVTELPSVRPREQTGHWKRISMDRYTTHAQYWYECDKCGEHNLGNTDFCPYCGCRMVEPKETETWHGIHAQITAPKGTFERIFNEADDDYDI